MLGGIFKKDNCGCPCRDYYVAKCQVMMMVVMMIMVMMMVVMMVVSLQRLLCCKMPGAPPPPPFTIFSIILVNRPTS